MTPPPLCIIQARLASSRLHQKMLQTLGNETLIARAWRMASAIFDAEHTVVAIPPEDESGPLGDELRRIRANIFAAYWGENDVLGRYWACAHTYRTDPLSLIVRWTPDDPFKSVSHILRVLDGERVPVELGCEAFTLEHLDAVRKESYRRVGPPVDREHITYLLFPTLPPKAPPGVWTIDTQEQLDAARAMVEDEAEAFR